MNNRKYGIGLKDLIRTVHEELAQSQLEREEQKMPPLFELESLDLELNFIIGESDKAEGKLDLKVFSIGTDISFSSEQVHKITLHLRALEEDKEAGFYSPRPIERERLGTRPKAIDDSRSED